MQFTFAFHIWGLSETWITRLSWDSLRFTWIYLDRLHDSPACGCSPLDPYRAADPPGAGALLGKSFRPLSEQVELMEVDVDRVGGVGGFDRKDDHAKENIGENTRGSGD